MVHRTTIYIQRLCSERSDKHFECRTDSRYQLYIIHTYNLHKMPISSNRFFR